MELGILQRLHCITHLKQKDTNEILQYVPAFLTFLIIYH